MLSLIKAEFIKLFTVRSTYIMAFLAFGITAAYILYFEGYKGNTGSPAAELAPTALQSVVSNGASMGVLFACITAILFMAHEYRYNTILYTLTLNVRRNKVLLVKLFTISVFGAIYGLIFVLVMLGSYLLGLELRGANLPAQDFNMLVELARVSYYYLGYCVLGLLLAVFTRSVVAAIATVFIGSTMIEPLISVILKDNSKYLPVTSLDSTIGASISAHNTLSPNNALIVSLAYLLVGSFIAWLLFTRRDAN